MISTKINIPNLADATKQEEIDFLKLLANSLSENSYLRGLFSDRLVFWASEQIKNDFPCDVWDLEVERLMKELNQKIGELTVEQRDNQRLQNDLQREKEANASRADAYTRRTEFLESCLKSRDDQIEYFNQHVAELTIETADLRSQLALATQKQLELKARIYDLEHGEK